MVHYWADLQSANGFHCYDNIVLNKCSYDHRTFTTIAVVG